jgi:hypothetical protein
LFYDLVVVAIIFFVFKHDLVGMIIPHKTSMKIFLNGFKPSVCNDIMTLANRM